MNQPAGSTLPVVVGVAQVAQRVDDPSAAREPLALMEDALRRAAEDAGSRELLTRADALYVIRGIWPYRNPAAVLAERLGNGACTTFGTPFGGNTVQSSVHHAALRIARGECEIALLTGAETGRTQQRARTLGVSPSYTAAPGSYHQRVAEERPMNGPAELARGISRPIQLYPIFESALRHRAGESLPAHRLRIAKLWARFSEVAERNPDAWLRERFSAEQIATPSARNRMVGYPYTKLMNANDAVDQGAALILCSSAAARRLGLARERWIFPHAGADGHDHFFVSERQDLYSSPAIRIAGARALELAGRSLDEIAHLDLYSCFPSAVQVAMNELGIDSARSPTVTGGLTFAGGPLNNYVMHSIARMVQVLREDRGSFGLVTANGGFLTKHSMGIYSAEEPAGGYRFANVQAEIDALPRRAVAIDAQGRAEIEGYTVMFNADGPTIAHAACLLPDGTRTWANSQDSALLDAMTREEHVGRTVELDGSGGLELA
ncbi:MAG TPA: acetyl-CoA acetyltransferase [Polyangiales bacterium]|nr:acetyl-CoA acetyltransferase [Polyangiales bacterium]